MTQIPHIATQKQTTQIKYASVPKKSLDGILSKIPNRKKSASFSNRLRSWRKISYHFVTETLFPDELVNEKEKYKNIADEMDQAFSELSGF